MAIAPTIAGAPQLAPIPIPQQSTEAVDGLGALVGAASNAVTAKRQTDIQVARMDLETAVRAREEQEANIAATGQNNMFDRFDTAQQAIADSRSDPGTTLDSHRQLTASTVAQFRADALSGFTDDRVRQRFMPVIDRKIHEMVAGEDAWQRGVQAQTQALAGQSAINRGSASVQQNPTMANFQAEHEAVTTIIDALHVDLARRPAVMREVDAKLMRGMSDGLLAQGKFAEARALAGTRQFGEIFGADGVKLTMAQADQGETEAAAAAKAAATAAKDAAEKQMDALSATIEQGGIIAPGDLRTAATTAQAAGVDPAKIIRFQGLGVTQAINQQFGPAVDPDGSKTRAALTDLNQVAATRALTSDESVRYDRLLKLSGARRVNTAEALKPLFGKSVAGDVQGLAQLDQLPQADRFDVAERIRPGLAYTQLLDPHDRADAVQGQFDLRANPDLIKVQVGNAKIDKFTPQFRAHLGAMVDRWDENTIKGYQQAAEGIYATRLKNEGKTGWQPDIFARAANIALGARLGTDGKWYGGMGQVNGFHVMLPDWSTADALATVLARGDFSAARYKDNRPAEKEDVLTHYAPVLVGYGDGHQAVYRFRGPDGGVLGTADGRPFEATINQGGR